MTVVDTLTRRLNAYERILTHHTDWVTSVSWSPNGTTLASSSEDRTVCVWSVPMNKCIRTIDCYMSHDGARYGVKCVAWSPDGSTLASASHNSVRVWQSTQERPLYRINGHGSWVNDIAWSPSGTTLATASSDKTVRLWYGEDCIRTLFGHSAGINSLAWAPRSRPPPATRW